MNSQYKELTDRAFLFHQTGELDKALKIYESLLSINPDDANILNLAGLLMIAKGEIYNAIDLLTKAFIINRSSQVASNLAKAYYSADMPDKAIKLYKEALKTEESDDIYYSLGLAYKKTGDLIAAIESYHKALDQNPGNYSACYNLSLAYFDTGDVQKAISYAEKCAILRHDDEFLFGILSGFYEQVNEIEKAVEALEKAIKINPDNFLYYYNMAVLSSRIGNNDKATYGYLKSISLNPNYIEAYVNLANIIKEQDNNKAIEYLIKAYNINPREENILLSLAQSYKDAYKNAESIKILTELLMSNPMCDEAYSLIAMNYMDIGQYEKALKNYDLALKINPNNLNFKHGRAVALKYLGRTDECLEILENIVQQKDAPIEAKVTLGMLYLQNKEFEKGMNLYRLRAENIKSVHVNKEVFWSPKDDITNKTILVYSNCGLGDSIMYSRYLPVLAKKTKVILQTDKDLLSIMQESFPSIQVISKTVKPPEHDYLLQFMDIQLALNMGLDDIPSSKGYLKANKDLTKMFSKLAVFNTPKKKIGLYWQGNKRIFKNRSIKFEQISRLTENKNCSFYSFQLGEKIDETDNFFDLSPHIKDYSDTAALLKNIDILITIDSSIVHMAGALGVKTYLLLPKTAEWRWFDDTKKTQWYDSVTIFRQKESTNWEEVIDRVSKKL